MTLSHEEFLAARERAYSGRDRDLYLDVGFFVAWYAQAELAITAVLAASTRALDLEAFDILCKGMDARVKIERLRLSAKRHGGIGPNANARLTFFEKICPLRNKLVHSILSINEDEGTRRYWLSGLANMPWNQLNIGPKKTSLEPYEVTSREVYSSAVWLSFFALDIATLQRPALAHVALEIDNPKSRLPEADHPQKPRKARHAKAGKRPRTENGSE